MVGRTRVRVSATRRAVSADANACRAHFGGRELVTSQRSMSSPPLPHSDAERAGKRKVGASSGQPGRALVTQPVQGLAGRALDRRIAVIHRVGQRLAQHLALTGQDGRGLAHAGLLAAERNSTELPTWMSSGVSGEPPRGGAAGLGSWRRSGARAARNSVGSSVITVCGPV